MKTQNRYWIIVFLFILLSSLENRLMATNEVSFETNQLLENKEVIGVVKDDLGPVAGASISIKGTNNGTITDSEGKFTIKGINQGDVIIVSFIGYVSQEITYTGQSVISIQLVEDSKKLEEVVIVGYGTQKKHLLPDRSPLCHPKTLKTPPSRIYPVH